MRDTMHEYYITSTLWVCYTYTMSTYQVYLYVHYKYAWCDVCNDMVLSAIMVQYLWQGLPWQVNMICTQNIS